MKLGAGSFEKNYITEAAMQRAMVALTAQIAAIKNQYCDRVLAFATAAVRNASNGQEFIDKVYENFNVQIRVVDGDKEAKMIYRGVQLSEALDDSNSVMMDIGGGSTEFIIANNQEIVWKKSYELGITRLFEKFKPSDPIHPDQLTTIQEYIQSQTGELFGNLEKEKVSTLVGSSGSFETFSDILSYRRGSYNEDILRSSLEIPIMDLRKLLYEIISSSRAQRHNMRGLDPIRIEIIAISAIFVKLVLENTKIDTVKLSRYALKEGVLFDVLKGNI